MRKALLIVAMLLLATPVMAATTITAVNEGITTVNGVPHATIRIGYSGTVGVDPNVRAFALDMNVDGGTVLDRIKDFNTGESNGNPGRDKIGYGIFPGRFRDYIVVTGPNWVDTNYNPVAPSGDPGASGSGLDTNHVIAEMGTLYAGDVNRPALSGTLFRIDVNSQGQTSCVLTIAANAMRGGMVGNDGNPVATNLPITLPITFQEAPSAPAQLIYPKFDADSNLPIYWSPVAGATGYDLERSSNSGGSYTSTIVNNLNVTFKADSVTPSPNYRYRVRARNAVGNSPYTTGTFDCNAYLSTCYRNGNTADPNWANWKSAGRPDCWCKISTVQEPNGSGFQCDGDADGLTSGAPNNYRVYSGDLTLLTGNWKKKASDQTNDPNIIMAGKLKISGAACANLSHVSSGAPNNYRVYSKDLTILTSNWKKKNTNLATNCPR